MRDKRRAQTKIRYIRKEAINGDEVIEKGDETKGEEEAIVKQKKLLNGKRQTADVYRFLYKRVSVKYFFSFF